VIVLGARADKIRPALARLPVLAVDNPAWPEGMASSIRAGIAALQKFSRAIDAAVIALCDQPAFSSAIIEKLRAVQRESASSIVAARYGGRRGAPALFLREHFAALNALTGEEGARSLLNDASGRVATVDLPDLAVDLDTPDDYAAVKNGFSPL
jgi:molybdenum cofactor cytidylyltransferase